MIERKGMIVYFQDEKALNKLDKFLVNVYFVSHKNNYAIIYFDAKKYKNVVENISHIKEIISFEDALNNIGDYSFEEK